MNTKIRIELACIDEGIISPVARLCCGPYKPVLESLIDESDEDKIDLVVTAATLEAFLGKWRNEAATNGMAFEVDAKLEAILDDWKTGG
jgi:hypothetical protein